MINGICKMLLFLESEEYFEIHLALEWDDPGWPGTKGLPGMHDFQG